MDRLSEFSMKFLNIKKMKYPMFNKKCSLKLDSKFQTITHRFPISRSINLRKV